jgi:hypothetical protein
MLKVFDYRNIKELPQIYMLKRWRRTAKSTDEDNQGNAANDNRLSLNISVPSANHHHGLQSINARIEVINSQLSRFMRKMNFLVYIVPDESFWSNAGHISF